MLSGSCPLKWKDWVSTTAKKVRIPNGEILQSLVIIQWCLAKSGLKDFIRLSLFILFQQRTDLDVVYSHHFIVRCNLNNKFYSKSVFGGQKSTITSLTNIIITISSVFKVIYLIQITIIYGF